jgi:hypothetical protein
MSFLALPQDYRFAILNLAGPGNASSFTLSGAGVFAPTIVGRRMRFDTNGLPAYESSTTTFFSLTQTGLSTGSYFAGSQFSNFSSLWLGGEFLISTGCAGSNASGSLIFFIETSPDGGTTWPTPASGGGSSITLPGGATVVAAIGFGSTASVISNLSMAVRVNFNL